MGVYKIVVFVICVYRNKNWFVWIRFSRIPFKQSLVFHIVLDCICYDNTNFYLEFCYFTIIYCMNWINTLSGTARLPKWAISFQLHRLYICRLDMQYTVRLLYEDLSDLICHCSYQSSDQVIPGHHLMTINRSLYALTLTFRLNYLIINQVQYRPVESLT